MLRTTASNSIVYRAVAEAAYGPAGAHLVDLWNWYNSLFFRGECRSVLITRNRVFAYGACVGFTAFGDSREVVRHLQVKTMVTAVCEKQRAILLHEMLHQYLGERGRNTKHAGQDWCDEIMRLTKLLGGEPVWAGRYGTARIGKRTVRCNKPPAPETNGIRCLDQKQIAGWPQSIGVYPPDCNVQQ